MRPMSWSSPRMSSLRWTTSLPPDTGWTPSWPCSTSSLPATWDLAGFDEEGLRRAREVIAGYSDRQIGLADASIVVLADRYRTRTVASLDRRHVDVLRSLGGGYFEVLPWAG